jgi:anti-sigma factor RsiW
VNCQTLVELLTEYLEDRMPPEDRAQLDAHLARCRHCVLYFEQFRMTVRTMDRLQPETVSIETRTTVLAAFGDWNAGRA